MIQVAGGTYRELCREPYWDHLFGSGLRAAATLGALTDQVSLSTYIGVEEGSTLDAYLLEFQISPGEIVEIPSTLQFSYVHGLARPWIDPPLHLIRNEEALRVEATNVLRYGMLEGDAIVQAENAVYDPQSAYDPQPFLDNGSRAERLAIVANMSEGRALTRRDQLDHVGRALLDEHGADVAIIKRGAAGVRVFSDMKSVDVPAHRSAKVFPIGSGDVFSAVFAYYWAEQDLSSEQAARRASRATAWYCTTKRLLIPTSGELAKVDLQPIRPRENEGPQTRRVYVAGAFFTTAQRWLVEEARDGLLQQGVVVFSPFHDVGIGPACKVATADIDGLKQSDAVFAIIDGLDAGTLFEVGYARSCGIPVIALVQNTPEEPLKMLAGTGCEIVDDFATAVYRAAWSALER